MTSIFAAIINCDSDILAKVSASLKSQVYKIANKFTIILSLSTPTMPRGVRWPARAKRLIQHYVNAKKAEERHFCLSFLPVLVLTMVEIEAKIYIIY